jgi:alpha-L-rhamnosidase
VDWPAKERDEYVMKPINTVVNAFYIRSLNRIAEMASALGKEADAAQYTTMETKARAAFQRILFDPAKGAYRDGEDTNHMSQHANLFPLAFGLVPPEEIPTVLKFIHGRDMACSVYAAQYLMEALFINQAATRALELITAPTDRSWRHMVESGATITWEAWDLKYKPNQDWNHAWGAAPANLLPRFILGAEPLTPGWKLARIRPQTAVLTFAKGKIPTPKGPITVDWKNDTSFQMKLALPDGMTAKIEVPARPGSKGVKIDGKPAATTRVGSYWHLNQEISGSVTIDVVPS